MLSSEETYEVKGREGEQWSGGQIANEKPSKGKSDRQELRRKRSEQMGSREFSR